MKYKANPVVIDAEIIIRCGDTPGVTHIWSDASVQLTLQSGRVVVADKGMTARYIPQEGDYLVTQEDGYVYISPKAVFERKYSAL